MEQDLHTDEQLREILGLKRVAVVGMSKDPAKAAHYVPKYLSENGYEVIPVNPNATEILGAKCHASVSDVQSGIDIVDVFRPSDQVLPIVKEAIAVRPKVIWLQEGIHDPEAERLARDAGIDIVYDRCMLAEHRRLS